MAFLSFIQSLERYQVFFGRLEGQGTAAGRLKSVEVVNCKIPYAIAMQSQYATYMPTLTRYTANLLLLLLDRSPQLPRHQLHPAPSLSLATLLSCTCGSGLTAFSSGGTYPAK